MRADYVPIREYGLIGDCHGSALVSLHGSVDWCCLERFDADPVFCRILDAEKGGYFLIRPAAPSYETSRKYSGGTNILETTFEGSGGAVRVIDFMPVGRARSAGVHDYTSLVAPFWLVRVIEGLEGRLDMDVRYRPSVDFARRRPALTHAGGRIEARPGGPVLTATVALEIDGDEAAARFSVSAGSRHYFVVSRQASGDPVEVAVPRLLSVTRAFWTEWCSYCRYRGPYEGAVMRSALALKLLTYAPTGAIVAAPTTSLPEEIGGHRNWDYRYCWLRDASFTLYALAALGYSGEARRFSQFLQRCCGASNGKVQVVYGIAGESELPERELAHLEGYRASRPVRIGNGAYAQEQLDIFGELLDWAFLYKSLGGGLKPHGQALLRGMASAVAERWARPDHGLWEIRREGRQHVFGKIMSWVAIDRAIRLLGDSAGLASAREAIRKAVQAQGVDPTGGGHLVQEFGSKATDAALLLTPMLGFPVSPATLEATVRRIDRELRRGDFLLRYVTDDGLGGREGAFLICSFWLVDALLHLDRGDEARQLYERLLRYSNDLGLFAEEIDPSTHEFLGNFPQAFTHLALIQSATNLELYERRGAEAMRGTYADRARYGVEATAGLRALVAAFKKTGKVGRLRSSKASQLAQAGA